MAKCKVTLTDAKAKGRGRLTLYLASGPVTIARGESKELELDESAAAGLVADGFGVEEIKAGKAKKESS